MLENKIIAVIGASSGIGAGIAHAIAQQKPKGLVLAARREKELTALSEKLGGDILVVPTDVTSLESLDNLFSSTIKRYGKLDAIVNSAGVIQTETPVEEIPDSEIEKIITTNLTQAILVGKRASYLFKQQGFGIYVAISSQAGHPQNAFKNETAYNASKAGLDQFMRTLDAEWLPLRSKGPQLYAFSIAPGFINTEEAKRQFPKFKADIEKSPTPAQFGEIVLEYLINPKLKYHKGGVVHLINTLKI